MDFDRFISAPLDPDVQRFFGWTLPNERRFNQWYAREAFRGMGEIVDLGCMNGSSTAALASGLAANPRAAGRKVHAFDRFIKSWPTIPGEPLEDIPQGGDFFARFTENTAPWRDLIDPYRGDIGKFTWTGGPIEYLLVDLMKSWDTAAMAAEKFFPSLLDRDALVVHQDFLHYYTPWIHLVMFRLRERLVPAFEVPDSCTMVFRTAGDLGLETCRKAADFTGIEAAEVDEAFEWSDSIVRKNSKGPLRAAKAMFFWHYAHRKPAADGRDGRSARWLERAVEEYRRIEPAFRREKDVLRAGALIDPSEGPTRPSPSAPAAPSTAWRLTALEGAVATLTATDDRLMRVEIGKLSSGPPWHLQLTSPPIPVTNAVKCTVSFRARAEAARTVRLLAVTSAQRSNPIGLAREIAVDREWRDFRFEFLATASDPAARLRFNLNESDAAIELADVEFATPARAATAPRRAKPAEDRRAEVLQAVIPPGGTGAECGVFKGEFSRALLERLGPSRLYLIDPWYRHCRAWHWGEGDRSTISAVCAILRDFEDELVDGRVVLQIDDDLEALARMPDHHLDWAYVDSTHQYAPTVKELALLRKKVRPGGIIAGHDWQPDPSHRHHGVCKAVREAVARGECELVLVDEPTIQWAVRLPD